MVASFHPSNSNHRFFLRETAVMGPHSFRPTLFGVRAHRRRINRFAGLRFETLEGRIAPALFTVQNPGSITGLNNNGCVAVADFNKDGFADAVLTNFGTDYAAGAGNNIIILRNKADGSGGFFRTAATTGGTNVAFAAVGDLNGVAGPRGLQREWSEHRQRIGLRQRRSRQPLPRRQSLLGVRQQCGLGRAGGLHRRWHSRCCRGQLR